MAEVSKNIPASFENYKEVDSRFTEVEIWIMHTEENYNNSYFSKEVIEEAIPTLANTPILGFIEKNSDDEYDYSDHRQVLVKEDGEFKIEYLCDAYGVIPENNNARFEKREDDNGVEREYLVVDGLMWKKWDDPVDILEQANTKQQSMEITDIDGEFNKDDNLYHFSSFKFFGACILGDQVSPAMAGSTIEVKFSADDFMTEINNKMEEFKKIQKDADQQGGLDMSKANKDFSLTSNQFKRELMLKVSEQTEVIEDFFGDFEIQKFYYVDHNDEKVFCESREDKGRLVGFNYSVNGDVPEVDFESKQLFKVEFTPMEIPEGEEENEEVEFSLHTKEFVADEEKLNNAKVKHYEDKVSEQEDKLNDFETKVTDFETKLGEKETEFNTLQEQFTSLEEEKESLLQFKNSKIEEEHKKEIDSVIEKFSSQLEDSEIEEIKNDAYDMETKELENKIFAYLGRKAFENFSVKKDKKSSNKISIDDDVKPKSSVSWASYMEE